MVSVQLQLQAAQRQTARQEALAEAAEARLTKLKEENNEVGSRTLPKQLTYCTFGAPNE